MSKPQRQARGKQMIGQPGDRQLRVYRPAYLSRPIMALALGLVIIIGIVFIFSSKAATPVTSSEVENGTTTSGASVISDAKASGGKAVSFATSPNASCTLSALDVPSCGALWGAYVPNYGLTTLETEAGRSFAIFQEYHDMSATASGQIPSANDLKLMNNGQRILFATWASREYASGTNYTWQQIADGAVDAQIDANAARIKAVAPTKLFLAFDSEMEGSTHTVDGDGPQYVAAFRHIHDRMKADGVTNIIWAWIPAGSSGNWGKLPTYYPGDAYVDWVGWDPYNFYSCNGRTTWNDVNATYGSFYNWLNGGGLGAVGPAAAAKPRILGEYGSHDDPADATRNQAWYASIPTDLQTNFPQLKAVMQWDSVGVCDSRIDTIPPIQAQTLAGFKTAGLESYVDETYK